MARALEAPADRVAAREEHCIGTDEDAFAQGDTCRVIEMNTSVHEAIVSNDSAEAPEFTAILNGAPPNSAQSQCAENRPPAVHGQEASLGRSEPRDPRFREQPEHAHPFRRTF